MHIDFIHPSEIELEDAYNHYEDQSPGLGIKFLEDFRTCLNVITTNPTLWAKVGKRTRKTLFKKFPFFILYIPEKDSIHITCIAHQHRNPEYFWGRQI